MVQEIKVRQDCTEGNLNRITQELKEIKRSFQNVDMRLKSLENSHQELHDDVEKRNERRSEWLRKLKHNMDYVHEMSVSVAKRVDELDKKMACCEEMLVSKDDLEEKIRNISINETHFHVSESLSIRYKEKRELPTSMTEYQED